MKTLTIALAGVRLEDPHHCTDMRDVLSVLSALFDPLTGRDQNLGFYPALAESMDVSDDARTWTFRLRSGVRFHHGAPVDAEAVKFSLERMARPDLGAALGAPGVYHQYLGQMKLEVMDRTTVRLTAPDPLADLPDLLTGGFILPPDRILSSEAEFLQAPIGTGPYEFVEHSPGQGILARKNPAYFQGAPDYDFVEWLEVPDPAERLRLVREGRALIASDIPPDAVPDSSGPVLIQTRGATVYILIFNAARGPLADARVRLALNLGLDREALIDRVLGGAGFPLTGFVSPHHIGFDPHAPGPAQDPDRARELLRQAGYGPGLTLTLDSPTSMPDEAPALAEALAEQLKTIGVHLETIFTPDRKEYAEMVSRKEIHDLCVFDSSPLSTFRVLLEKVDSRFNGPWRQGYRNPAVEKLLGQARASVDVRRRSEIYRQCFRRLNEDPPWLYLYNKTLTYAAAPELGRFRPPGHGVIEPGRGL